MTYVPAPNVAKVACIGTYGGQEIVNVLHFHRDTAFDVGDLEDLCHDVSAVFRDALSVHQDADMVYTSFVATDLSTETGPTFTYIPSVNTGGLDSGEALPGNAAVCVTKRTAGRGRSKRGRIFIGALNSTMRVATNLLSSTYVGHFLSDLAPLLSPMSTSGFICGVLSYWHDHVKLSEASFEPLTALTCDQSLDNMRRRSDGRGV